MSTINEDEKLEWMYKNANEIVDREEYLLGRKLDKNLETQSNFSANESIPSSIFSLPECTNRVDALRKIKEDPLEAIREKEMEMRKELLKNPIQMKKLQKMVEAQKNKSKVSDQEKKKNMKKHSSSKDGKFDDDSELDAVLSKKLAKLIKRYGKDEIFNSGDNKLRTKKGRKKKSKYDKSSSSSEDDSDSSNCSDEFPKKLNKRRKYEGERASGDYKKHSPSLNRRSPHDSSSELSDDDRSSKKFKKNHYGNSKDSEKYSRYNSKKAYSESTSSRTDHGQYKNFESYTEAQKNKGNDYRKEQVKKTSTSQGREIKSENELDNVLSMKFRKFIKKYGEDEIVNLSKHSKTNKKGSSKKSSHKKSSSSSDSSSNESDVKGKKKSTNRNEIQRKQNYEKCDYNRKKKVHDQRSLSDCSSDSNGSDNDRSKKLKNSRSKEDEKPICSFNRESSESRMQGSPRGETKQFGLIVPKGARKISEYDSNRKQEQMRQSKNDSGDRKRSRSRERGDCKDGGRSGKYSERRSRSRDRGRNNYRKKTAMSQEEKDKKFKEMMDNVSWRNNLMEENSKRHKEQLQKEQDHQEEYDANFTRNQLSKGIYAESVEKRIKSKIHNIQRSSFAMDKHFTKR